MEFPTRAEVEKIITAAKQSGRPDFEQHYLDLLCHLQTSLGVLTTRIDEKRERAKRAREAEQMTLASMLVDEASGMTTATCRFESVLAAALKRLQETGT